MQFRVLGPLQVIIANGELTLGAAKLRNVLAMLIVNHNRLVTTEALIDELWADNPPRSVMTTLQTYIYHLRKLMIKAGVGESPIITNAGGYSLRVPSDSIDLWHFERLVTEARTAAGPPQRLEHVARLLQEAVGYWHGKALANVTPGPRLRAHITLLDERHLDALEARFDVDLQLGRYRQVIGELKHLTMVHPLHEGFFAELMVALYGSGRQGEALATYQRLRGTLVRELGVEPTARLRQLHQAVLAGAPPTKLGLPAEALVPQP